MSEINEGWLEVSEEAGIEVEDIIRFDHENKTYCVYKLEDGYYATDGLCTHETCLLYTSPSPRDKRQSRMPSSA